MQKSLWLRFSFLPLAFQKGQRSSPGFCPTSWLLILGNARQHTEPPAEHNRSCRLGASIEKTAADPRDPAPFLPSPNTLNHTPPAKWKQPQNATFGFTARQLSGSKSVCCYLVRAELRQLSSCEIWGGLRGCGEAAVDKGVQGKERSQQLLLMQRRERQFGYLQAC